MMEAECRATCWDSADYACPDSILLFAEHPTAVQFGSTSVEAMCMLGSRLPNTLRRLSPCAQDPRLQDAKTLSFGGIRGKRERG